MIKASGGTEVIDNHRIHSVVYTRARPRCRERPGMIRGRRQNHIGPIGQLAVTSVEFILWGPKEVHTISKIYSSVPSLTHLPMAYNERKEKSSCHVQIPGDSVPPFVFICALLHLHSRWITASRCCYTLPRYGRLSRRDAVTAMLIFTL